MRARPTYDEDGNYSVVPPYPRDLIKIATGVMELHWQPSAEFVVPNSVIYPWMWLWDSCFHSVVWAWLGDHRCESELASIFDFQLATGFVPHMGYQTNPNAARDLWGVHGHSTITQPPMYGHALRLLDTLGYRVHHLHDMVRNGLLNIFQNRMTEIGLIAIYHPWESGADDSPRWEKWQPHPYDRAVWQETKQRLVSALNVRNNEAIGSEEFVVCPAGFNALVAWNAVQAGEAIKDPNLTAMGSELARRIDKLLWNDTIGTWVDVDSEGSITSSVRTLDNLLPILVTPDKAKLVRVFESLIAENEFNKPFGPSGVHPDENVYDPRGYWRGSTWPHLTYLLWQAALASGSDFKKYARILSSKLAKGADASGFAEYWSPETGEGLGARPQSWTSVAAIPLLSLRRDIGNWTGP